MAASSAWVRPTRYQVIQVYHIPMISVLRNPDHFLPGELVKDLRSFFFRFLGQFGQWDGRCGLGD